VDKTVTIFIPKFSLSEWVFSHKLYLVSFGQHVVSVLNRSLKKL